MSAIPSEHSVATPVQLRGMRNTVLGQAFGALGYLSFANGLVLLYLTKIGFGSAQVMFLLTLPHLLQTGLILPLAQKADREGKKRIAVRGAAVSASGIAVMTGGGFLGDVGAKTTIVVGILLYAFGQSMLNCGWYALLSPMVPAPMRGAFFGRLRVTWQLAGFFFGIVCTFILSAESPLGTMQAILGLVFSAMFIRLIFMAQLPELDTPETDRDPLIAATAEVLRAPGYASFCCYAFLITLVTFCAPNLFVLIEKQSLKFSDQAVVWMGNLMMMGSVVGFLVGGKLIDRKGTKFVFLVSHFSFGLILFSFLLRGIVPLPIAYWTGLLGFAFGAVQAASSIAISTEMLALIPPTKKALSTGLCTALLLAGNALSGVMVSGAISLKIFREGWTLFGTELGSYDAMLLIFAVFVVILVVALGLVPSVIMKAQWAPKGDSA